MKRSGRYVRLGQRLGERHPRAKLTEAKVREIRSRFRWRDPVNGVCALAIAYGVGRETLRQVVIGKTWVHVR